MVPFSDLQRAISWQPKDHIDSGPSPSFVRDSEGREVHGLRATKTNRTDHAGQPIIRYYSFDESKTKVYHGDNRDKQLAIFRFKQWEAQRADER